MRVDIPFVSLIYEAWRGHKTQRWTPFDTPFPPQKHPATRMPTRSTNRTTGLDVTCNHAFLATPYLSLSLPAVLLFLFPLSSFLFPHSFYLFTSTSLDIHRHTNSLCALLCIFIRHRLRVIAIGIVNSNLPMDRV